MLKKILARLRCPLVAAVRRHRPARGLRYGDYHSFISRPSVSWPRWEPRPRHLVDPLFIAYDILLIAFGVGVWTSAGRTTRLAHYRSPAGRDRGRGPDHPPDVPAGDGEHIERPPAHHFHRCDRALHPVGHGLGASLYGRRWRLYSFATLLTLLVSGAWTGF